MPETLQLMGCSALLIVVGYMLGRGSWLRPKASVDDTLVKIVSGLAAARLGVSVESQAGEAPPKN